MENKTVEENNDIQIDLIIADWMDREATGNSQVYMAELNMIRGAIKEYASLQCAEMKEQNERLRKAVVHFQASRDEMDELNKQLQEEVERLKTDIMNANTEIDQFRDHTKSLHETIDSMRTVLEGYERWEADVISEDKLWWPNVAKDFLRGHIYDKMMDLQRKRNEVLYPDKYKALSGKESKTE